MSFFDTNVFVYAFPSTQSASRPKYSRRGA